MKEKMTRLLGIMGLFFACITMAACSYGGEITTSLTVADDMSGSRVMEVAINEEAFAEYFSGTVDDLKNIVLNNCPAVLRYSFEEGENGLVMKFELPFDSLDEYRYKVKILYPDGEVLVETPESVWGSGIKFNENFMSDYLLNWAVDSLVEAGYVSNDYAGYIFKEGNASLSFCGKTYDCARIIQVDDLVSVRLYYIDVVTDVKDEKTFDRAYVFHVVSDTIGNKKKDIKKYFEDKAGSFGKITESSDSTCDNFSVIATGLDIAKLEELDKTLFNSASVNTLQGEQEDYFATVTGFNEEFAVDDYAYTEWGIIINNYVRVPDSLSLKQSMDASWDMGVLDSLEYPGFGLISSLKADRGIPATNNFALVKKYNVQEVDITTKHLNKNNFEKHFVFVMDETVTDEDAVKIGKKIMAAFGKLSKEEDTVSVSVFNNKAKKQPIKINVILKGNGARIEEMLTEFSHNKAELVYAERYSVLLPVYEKVLKDYCNIDDITRYHSGDFKKVYTVDMGFGSKIIYTDNALSVIEGRKVSVSKGDPRGLTVKARVINGWAVISYLLILASCVCVIMAFVLARKKASMTPEMLAAINEKKAAKAEAKRAEKDRRSAEREIKKQKQAEVKAKKAAIKDSKPKNDVIYRPANLPARGQNEAERASLETQNKTCPNCGAALGPDDKFCTGCGKKVE